MTLTEIGERPDRARRVVELRQQGVEVAAEARIVAVARIDRTNSDWPRSATLELLGDPLQGSGALASSWIRTSTWSRSKLDRSLVPREYRVEGPRRIRLIICRPRSKQTPETAVMGNDQASGDATSTPAGQRQSARSEIERWKPDGDARHAPLDPFTSARSLRVRALLGGRELCQITRIDYDKISRPATTREMRTLGWKRPCDVVIRADPSAAMEAVIAQQLQESRPRPIACFGSVNTGYGDDSRFRRDLDPPAAAAHGRGTRSIRALTDLLSRHPRP